MKFDSKNFRIKNTKNYIKSNNLFFFASGINQNTDEWLFIEQNLKNLNFSYYKICNKITIKIVKDSILANTKHIINGITFFLKTNTNIKFKNILLNKLNPLILILLTLKINNKIYSINQLKNTNSLNIFDNQFIFYKFGVITLKLLKTISIN